MDNLDKLLKTNPPTEKTQNKVEEFMSRLYGKDDDCADCDEITCPECKGQLESVFGSLPLEVKCKSCGGKFILRELLSDLL